MVAVVGVQWMLSCSVMNMSCGILARNGRYVAIVLLMSLRFCCCLGVRLGENLMMAKYMSALGKGDLFVLPMP